MKEWRREFDTSLQDTCMNSWSFQLQQEDGAAPIIKSVEIDRAGQGCPGHPQTISALVKDLEIDQIDLDALAATDCPRSLSCGQVFGQCVASLADV